MKKTLLITLILFPAAAFAQLDTLGCVKFKDDSAIVVRVPENSNDPLYKKHLDKIMSLQFFLNTCLGSVKDTSIDGIGMRFGMDQAMPRYRELPKAIGAIYYAEMFFYKHIMGRSTDNLLEEAGSKYIDPMPADDPYRAYRRFEISLDMMTKNLHPHRFTVFRGLDVNFADGRFSMYLQDRGLTIDDKSVVFTPTRISAKYIERVSSTGKEYITVNYTIKNTPQKTPYVKSEDRSCYIIQKVEITGTADLVIRTFINYWGRKMTIGGYKRGEIASYQVLGDYVVLSGTGRPGICKITITRGNTDVDYYSTFKIQ